MLIFYKYEVSKKKVLPKKKKRQFHLRVKLPCFFMIKEKYYYVRYKIQLFI